LIAGLSSSASDGPIGCTSGLDALEFGALDFGVLDCFLGVSGFFAIRRIWDESVSEKRANGCVCGCASSCQQVSASRFGTVAPYAVTGAAAALTISRWTPPQRVHRMVQYSAPARPVMMRRTASEALQSGQFASTGVACRVCSGRGMEIRPASGWPPGPPAALTDSRTGA
jgi:hypothetical protein